MPADPRPPGTVPAPAAARDRGARPALEAAPDPAPRLLRRLPTWQLTQVHARSHRIVTAALAQAGARGHHVRVLAALDELGPASQADLGRAVDLDRSDVAIAVDELQARGAVVRTPDPDDRRRKRVDLTPAGRRLLADLDDRLQQAQQQLLAPLTPDEQAVLVALLERLRPGAADGVQGP